MSLRYKFIISLLLFTLPVLFLGVISIYLLNKIAVPLQHDIPQQVQQLATSSTLGEKALLIRYYDEVLTQSARNYAFTGNAIWKTRYDQEALKLDTVLKEAIAQGDVSDRKIFSDIDASNTVLIQMEQESMVFAEKGDLKSAIVILDSPEYIAQKQIYQTGINSFVTKKGIAFDTVVLESAQTLENVTKESKTLITTSIVWIGGIIIISLIFVLVLAFILGNNLIYPIIVFKNNVQKITQGQLEERLPIMSKDELGQLAESFNEMMESIKESKSIINRKVEEQTQEITTKNKNMEDQQKAILNILEDVELEKKQVTIEKVKYEGLLTSIADGVVATDHEENIILINQAGRDMLGWKEEEIIGKKLTDIVPVVNEKGQKVSEELRPIRIALMTKKPFIAGIDARYYYVRKDGTKIPIALTAAPIIFNSEVIGVIDVFRDVTHEQNVDRMKTEFISLASHQLRTPLSAMKWFGEMLLHGDAGVLSTDQKEMIENIYTSNERMIELVNSLLNISRIESGRLMVDPKPTDAGAIIQDVVKILKQKFDEKNQTVVVSINEHLPLVPLDQKLIHEVYTNLITNAIKYTPKGGDIQIFLSKNDTDLVSQVTDNGYGIPKSEQERIFQKFFRAQNIVKMETEGTGLGLYLTKSVVESSGGKIWFTSEEGKGTTFFFTIPLVGMTAKKGEVGLEEKKVTQSG